MIDAHIHIGDFGYRGKTYGKFSEYQKIIQKTDIKKFCAVPIGLNENFENKTTPDNSMVLELSKKDKRIIPIYWLNVFDFKEKEIPFIVKNYKAVKFHPDIGNVAADDGNLVKILEKINLPVFVHSNESKDYSSLSRIINLANILPKNKIVAIHSGSVTRTFFKLFDYKIPKNLYFDVSGLQYELILKKIYELVGAKHIIFGSDYPFGDPRVALERIKVVAKDRKEFEQMTEVNISSILDI